MLWPCYPRKRWSKWRYLLCLTDRELVNLTIRRLLHENHWQGWWLLLLRHNCRIINTSTSRQSIENLCLLLLLLDDRITWCRWWELRYIRGWECPICRCRWYPCNCCVRLVLLIVLSTSRFTYVFLVILVLITASVASSIVTGIIPIIIVVIFIHAIVIIGVTLLIVGTDSICISDGRLIIPKCAAEIMIRIHILWFITLHASVMGDALILLMRESSTAAAVIRISWLSAIILGNIHMLIILGYVSFQ